MKNIYDSHIVYGMQNQNLLFCSRCGYWRQLKTEKLQEAFREHAAKQKQTLKGAFAADHAITADDRVDLEPDRLPIDEDPSDGA